MDDTYNDLYPLQLKDPEIPVQEDCSNDTVPAGTTNMEGKKKVLVPELITMTKVLFDRYRLDMYTYLNNCLHTGGLAAIVGKPIKTRVINHEICTFPGVTYWRIDRANFLADVTVELKLQTSTGLVEWRGCLTCWCGFDDNGLFFSIEDLDESLDRKDEGLDMLSPYLVPYATNKRVDEISEALWKKYLPEALDDPKQRIAAELVKRMGLTIEFHPVYEHRNVESIIFFKKDELVIGEDRKEKDANGKERHIKARFGKPVVIPANTIVINTNKINRDYSAFNIYHECYHYEEHYLFFCLQEMGSNDVRQVKTREVIVDKVDNPVSLYAATKKSDELLAHAYSKLYNIPSTGLRFFTVYGPAGRPDMFYFSATNTLSKGGTIKIFNYGDMRRDFTYIDDIVEGVYRVMQGAPEKKNGEDGLPIPPYAVYNIGGGQPENLLDYISTLQEELVRAKVLPEDYDFEGHRELVGMQAGDVPVTYADSEALERDYGFTPRIGIREGLRAFAEWYSEYYK